MNIQETLLYKYYVKYKELTPEAREALYKELMEYAKSQKEEDSPGEKARHEPSSISERQNRLDS